MNCKLVGNFVQHLEIILSPGEDFYAEKGALIYLESGIEKELSFNGSGLGRLKEARYRQSLRTSSCKNHWRNYDLP